MIGKVLAIGPKPSKIDRLKYIDRQCHEMNEKLDLIIDIMQIGKHLSIKNIIVMSIIIIILTILSRKKSNTLDYQMILIELLSQILQ